MINLTTSIKNTIQIIFQGQQQGQREEWVEMKLLSEFSSNERIHMVLAAKNNGVVLISDKGMEKSLEAERNAPVEIASNSDEGIEESLEAERNAPVEIASDSDEGIEKSLEAERNAPVKIASDSDQNVVGKSPQIGKQLKRSFISKIYHFIVNVFTSLFSTIASWFFKPPEKKESLITSNDCEKIGDSNQTIPKVV